MFAWTDGTTMLFFSLIVGLTALLTSLEAPVLEVAVASVSTIDEGCVELAEEMLANARDHATLASLACTIDALGAVLAIRSKVCLRARAEDRHCTLLTLCRVCFPSALCRVPSPRCTVCSWMPGAATGAVQLRGNSIAACRGSASTNVMRYSRTLGVLPSSSAVANVLCAFLAD